MSTAREKVVGPEEERVEGGSLEGLGGVREQHLERRWWHWDGNPVGEDAGGHSACVRARVCMCVCVCVPEHTCIVGESAIGGTLPTRARGVRVSFPGSVCHDMLKKIFVRYAGARRLGGVH